MSIFAEIASSVLSILFPGSVISKLHGARTQFCIQVAWHATDGIDWPRLLSKQGTAAMQRSTIFVHNHGRQTCSICKVFVTTVSLLPDPCRLRFPGKTVTAPLGGRTMPQKPTRRSSQGIWHGPRNAVVSALTDGRRGILIHSKSIIKERKRALEPNKGPSLVTLSAGSEDWPVCPCSFFCRLVVYFVAAPIPEVSF